MARIRTRLRKSREIESAAAAMSEMVSGSAPKKRPKVGLVKLKRQTKAMMDSGDWAKAQPMHLVGLYAVLHEMVYGIAPELDDRELAYAKLAARDFMRTKCKGDFDKAAAYMKWIWRRERSRETYRREKHIDGKVLGWRLVLRTPSMWTEYRIGQERRKHG